MSERPYIIAISPSCSSPVPFQSFWVLRFPRQLSILILEQESGNRCRRLEPCPLSCLPVSTVRKRLAISDQRAKSWDVCRVLPSVKGTLKAAYCPRTVFHPVNKTHVSGAVQTYERSQVSFFCSMRRRLPVSYMEATSGRKCLKVREGN